jgi:hypothetical protein
VKTNLEKNLSSCEPTSGLVVSQILCVNENTNDEVVLNLMLHKLGLRNYNNRLGLKILKIATMHFEIEISKS